MTQNSRINKFEKRRKNTKFLNYALITASALILFLAVMWIFGGENDETADTDKVESNDDGSFFHEVDEVEEKNEGETAEQQNDEESASEEEEGGAQDPQDETGDEDEIVTVEAEPSDENVKEAVMGNWPPVGTSQTGPHTTNFNTGSQDRIEIKQAVSLVTGISENDMIEWWVENGGEQKVIATVSDKTESDPETYRVYLSWIDNEGWQVTKLETLIENDKR